MYQSFVNIDRRYGKQSPPKDNLVAEVEEGCGSGIVGGNSSIIPTIVVVVAVTGFSSSRSGNKREQKGRRRVGRVR